ncbi:MAG: hypothetical protein IJ168_03510 [Eubacterium sp.]|nr:hypothetical protein [Eubacterium sp.]
MNNSIAKILKIIGCVMFGLGLLGGVITWIVMASVLDNGLAGFGTCIAIAVISFVSGMVFIGFSEIIKLLQEQNDLLKERFEATKITVAANKNAVRDKTVLPEEETDEKADEDLSDEYRDYPCPYCHETVSVSAMDVMSGSMLCPYCEQIMVFK